MPKNDYTLTLVTNYDDALHVHLDIKFYVNLLWHCDNMEIKHLTIGESHVIIKIVLLVKHITHKVLLT